MILAFTFEHNLACSVQFSKKKENKGWKKIKHKNSQYTLIGPSDYFVSENNNKILGIV
jgi:hypothetical protein